MSENTKRPASEDEGSDSDGCIGPMPSEATKRKKRPGMI